WSVQDLFFPYAEEVLHGDLAYRPYHLSYISQASFYSPYHTNPLSSATLRVTLLTNAHSLSCSQPSSSAVKYTLSAIVSRLQYTPIIAHLFSSSNPSITFATASQFSLSSALSNFTSLPSSFARQYQRISRFT